MAQRNGLSTIMVNGPLGMTSWVIFTSVAAAVGGPLVSHADPRLACVVPPP